MKKTFLILFASIISLMSIGQTSPNNVDVGLFYNGAHGSNVASGASVEIGLRIKPGGTAYTAVPAAEDFIMYFIVPKADFSVTDVINIVQPNTAIYGAT